MPDDEPSGAAAMAAEFAATLPGANEQDRKFLLVGILRKHLPPTVRMVLVGGSVVELYTLGAITSLDVDLVGDRPAIAGWLAAAGFRPEGRYFTHPEWNVPVEVPGASLRPTERVANVEYRGFVIPCVSAEDAVVDRLIAAKWWKSRTDWERAVALAAVQGPSLDWPELIRRADANDSGDIARELFALWKERQASTTSTGPAAKRAPWRRRGHGR